MILINPAEEKHKLQFEQEVNDDLHVCTLDPQVLAACPLEQKPLFSDILFSLEQTKQEPRGDVKRFCLQCSQCGKCAEASRDGSRLDRMMLTLKSRIKEKPTAYAQITGTSGTKVSMWQEFRKKAYYMQKKKNLGALYPILDKVPAQGPIVFFAGEHIFVDSLLQQWTLIQQFVPGAHIMGGLSLCSGYDFYIQGDLHAAHEQWAMLAKLFKHMGTKTVIAPTFGVYMSCMFIKSFYQIPFQIVSLQDWIASLHLSRQIHTPQRIAIYQHDQFAKLHTGQLADVLKTLTDVHVVGKGFAAMEYNYGVAQENAMIYRQLLIDAEKKGCDTLVVDCPYMAQAIRDTIGVSQVKVMDIADFVCEHVMKKDKQEEEVQGHE